MKRILSFICVLALAVSLCSMFSFAAAPEAEVEVAEAGEGARLSTEYEVVKVRTYLYNSPSTSSGYVFNGNIPMGYSVYRVDSRNYGVSPNIFYKVSYLSYTGYVLANNVEKKY